MQQDLLDGAAAPARELIGVREAAKRIGVAPSTISRQVGKLYVDHGTPGKPLLDWAQVQQARRSELNPALQRGAPAPAPAAPAAAAPAGQDEAPDTRGYWDKINARERALRAQADRMREFGELVERAAIEEIGFEVGRLLRDELKLLASDVASDIAGMTDPREIALFLEAKHRDLLDRVTAEAERRIKLTAPDQAAPAPMETPVDPEPDPDDDDDTG